MKCEICGKEIEKSMYGNAILCSRECFYDHFWIQKCKAQEADPYEYAIIDGESYHFNKDKPIVPDNGFDFLGFGGRKFTIRYNNGDTYTTNNLWNQGKIPEKFRDRLKDNAVFVYDRIGIDQSNQPLF